jgi:hypothetical protein
MCWLLHRLLPDPSIEDDAPLTLGIVLLPEGVGAGRPYDSTYRLDDARSLMIAVLRLRTTRENHSNADTRIARAISASLHSEMDRESPCAFFSQ